MNESELIHKLNELRALPAETEVVEFKEAKIGYDFSRIGKYFSALCNEANLKGKSEAWMVFGIENNQRNIVYTHYRENNRPYLDSLKGEIGDKTTNRITFVEIYELNLPQGRVLMFQIPAAPQGIPVAWEGHYYGRDGEQLVPLNLSELERIRKQAIRIDWSFRICAGATLNDLDPVVIHKARQNFKMKNPRLASEMDTWDDTTFLNKAKIAINGQITRTAILLLGKPESEHYIAPAVSCITWVLRDKDKAEKDYEHFYCPFILAVDALYKKSG